MNRFHVSFVVAATFIALFFGPLSPSFADTSYGGAYGGPYGSPGSPMDCRLNIDQMISNPKITKTIEYIDNITPSGAKYKPNQAVIARIKVLNTSNRIIPDVKVVNEIPRCFSYVAGPGTLNKGGNVLTIALGDLNSQEEQVFYVTYKAGDESCLPNEPVYCASNKMVVQGDICSAEDTAQLCIERQVLGTTKGGINIKQIPTTGPEYGLGIVALQAAAGAFGFFLKKKGQI